MSIIKFYRVDEPFGFFSNFAPYPIFIESQMWKTVEHYFQASKFEDEKTRLKIKEIDSPMKVANEGRKKHNIIHTDWEQVKDGIMKTALLRKFLQHPELRKKIILTGDNQLIEHTKNDSYWADGGDGSGKNRLGELLMEVRTEVQKQSNDPDVILPPWIGFPGISQYDMFWRMVLGENYITEWAKFCLVSDKEWYQKLFPENEDWVGTYD